MIPVAAGTAEFGIGNSASTPPSTSPAPASTKGRARTATCARWLAAAVRVALHVRPDGDIKSIAGLRTSASLSGFNAQKTIGQIIAAHLATAGLTYKDVTGVLTDVSRSAEDFTAGKTDVLFFALGSAAVKQAAATVGGLRVLPIDDTPELPRACRSGSPALHHGGRALPGDRRHHRPTKVVAFDMVL